MQGPVNPSAWPDPRHSLTRFFGRESEIGEVTRRMAASRLVTMVGPPGTGKTRLSVELARHAPESFRDGMRAVELAVVSDPADVVGALAVRLDIPEDSETQIEDSVIEALEPAEMLIVLDNCEHVVSRVAQLVTRILTECPGVRVLTTSRVPLAVPGEHLFRVPPLSSETAAELFIDRAALVTDLVMDDEAQEHVDRICRRLDGLPLAIELAAGQTRAFSLAEILARLTTELANVEVPGSTTTDRRTMTATIAWSSRLLSSSQNRLLERLSVLVGPFDLGAVEAIGPGSGDVVTDLSTLVDHSLVLAEPKQSGGVAYRLLEPVRQFAAARLEKRGDADQVRALHADHFLTVVREADRGLMGPEGPRCHAVLRSAEGNALAAVAWARGHCSDLALQLVTHLGELWQSRGHVIEARERVDGLLHHGAPSARHRAEALLVLCNFAYRQGRYEEAHGLGDEALQIMRDLNDEDGTGRALRLLAQASASVGQATVAVGMAQQSVEIFRHLGDDPARAWSLSKLGGSQYAAHAVDAAAEAFAAGLDLLAESGRVPTVSCRLHIGASLACAIRCDTAAHRAHLEAAISDLEEAGMLAGDYEWLLSASSLAHNEGRMDASLRLAGASRVLRHRGNVPPPAAEVVNEKAIEDATAHVGRQAAVRLMEEGGTMSTAALLADGLASPEEPASPLSDRELEIASLTGQGLTNAEIAERLFISRRTVESHQDHIRQKLELSSRYEVMAWALERRLHRQLVP